MFFLFEKNVGKVQSGKQINKKHFRNNGKKQTFETLNSTILKISLLA